MNEISSLLTVAEAATGQIEAALDSDVSPELASELQERAQVAIQLLNNMEAFLKAEAGCATAQEIIPQEEEIQLLFGT